MIRYTQEEGDEQNWKKKQETEGINEWMRESEQKKKELLMLSFE